MMQVQKRIVQLLLFIIIISGFFLKSISQTKNSSDSLNIILNRSNTDSVKQIMLMQLFDYQQTINWTKAIETAEKGTEYFKNLNPNYALYWNTELGKIYLDQGLYLSSLVSLKEAKEICEKNKLNKGEVLLYMAKNFYLQGKYSESINYYDIALKEFKKLKKTDTDLALKRIAKIYNKLGIVYELKGDIEKSEYYFKKALTLRKEIGDTCGIIDSYTSLGYFYDVINNNDSAITYFSKGLELCSEYNNYHYFNDLHLFRSASYLKQRKYEKAYSDIDTARIYSEKKQKFDLARVYFYYAKADFATNNFKILNKHIKKSFQYIDSFHLISLKLSLIDLFVDASIKQKDYKNAFVHLKEKNKISEEIYSEKLYNVEKSLESENKKRKIIELEEQSKKLKYTNKIYLITIVLSFISFLLVILFIFSNRSKNKKLNKRKNYFQTLFNNSPFGIAVIENTGNISDVNQSLLKILGSPSITKTFKFINIYNLKNLKESGFTEDFENVLKTGILTEREFSYTSEWGKKNILRSINIPLKNEKGDVDLIYSIIEDITNRKKNEQSILKLSEIVKQSTVSIIITDKYGVIDYVNPYFTEITGYSEEEAVGNNPNILKSGLTPEKTYKNLWKTLNEGKTWRGEFINKTKFGKNLWESSIIFPLKNDKNQVINYIGFLQDISEMKLLQESMQQKEIKLKELNKTKDKFFSIIAHDLKNPFGAILSLSDLLYQNFDVYDNQKKKDLIHIISEGAKNTYDLLENLLTWSRSQKGDINFSPEKLLFNKLIYDNIKLLSDMALKKKISVFFEPEEEIEIYADFNMLNFVIRNLLTNALKFTPQQGEIRFSVENKKKKTVFCIEDTGIGMNTEQLNALFKVGQTYSGKGTENETGTGLGLILCKDFIDFHKGKIRVQSELGKGSTVCVELPKK